jgi:5-methylcytosine-specific restriction endonuclease McrA
VAISLGLRFQILRRDNFACFLCEHPAPKAALRVRFLRPIMFGGVEDPTNLAAICDNCGGVEADLIPDGVGV